VIRHLASAALSTAAVFLCAAGCGPRDLAVVVSATGMGNILEACKSPSATSKCFLPGNSMISASTLTTALQARLFLADPTGGVRATSACFQLLPSSVNAATDPGGWAAGMARELNQELEGALPNGLTYPGLNDPSQVILTLALYQPKDDTGQCEHDALIACAGFEQPLAGGDYDISCASCQSGFVGAIGAHCPTAGTDCFFEECARVVAALP
jgi:hypothetical protein